MLRSIPVHARRCVALWVAALALISIPALGDAQVVPLCGDVTANGYVNQEDVDAFRQAFADPVGSPISFLGQSLCNTYPALGPCELLDLVVLQRDLISFGPGIQPICSGPLGPVIPEDDPNVDPNTLGGSPTPAVAYPVGTVDASFDVNTSGAATYTIPIDVPPGTRGIEPRISLGYNSQGGFGLAGVGFELNGLSSIERCPHTVAQDGETREVRFDADDRFCLDGLRLVALTGAYGQPDTIYRTEGETWTGLRSHDTCTAQVLPEGESSPVWVEGPCFFTARLKNGIDVKYGGEESEPCSFVNGAVDGGPKFGWPLTRVEDLHGNQLTITYRPGGANRCVPQSIDYTSNRNTGAPATRSVWFEYDINPRDVVHYTGGLKRSQNVKLVEIETYVDQGTGPELVKEYLLGYDIAPMTLRPRLTAVTECDAAGNCFPPTTFEYTDGTWPESGEQSNQGGLDIMRKTRLGDFNGDGYADLLQADSLQGVLYRSMGERFDWDSVIWGGGDGTYGDKYATGDFDGDGFTDALSLAAYPLAFWPGDPSAGWRLFLGNFNGLIGSYAYSGNFPSLRDRVFVGDYSGDGRTDVATLANIEAIGADGWENYQTLRLYTWNGATLQYRGESSFGDWDPYPYWGNLELYQGDFNGDGKVDILATFDRLNRTDWKIFSFNGLWLEITSEGSWPDTEWDVTPGDFNGDGLTDVILTPTECGSPYYHDDGYVLALSTGRTFVPVVNLPSPWTPGWGFTGTAPEWQDHLQVADFNLDGVDDLIVTYDPAHEGHACPSSPYDGVHLYRTVDNQLLWADSLFRTWETDPYLAYPAMDGRTLIIIDHPQGVGKLFYSYSNLPSPDLLRHITNGVGAETWLTYGTMSGQIHSKTYGSPYPTRDLIATRGLVSEVRRENGSPFYSNYRSHYLYHGAKSDLQGRGFLGFERIEVTENGKRTITEYHTDFPYAGSVMSQEVWGREPIPSTDYRLESRIEFTYDDISVIPDIYDVVMKTERTTFYADPNTPTLKFGKDYAYDAWGNVTKVTDYGDVTDDSHKLVTETTYHVDETIWRLGYPLEVRVYQDPNQPLSHKLYQYDAEMNRVFEGTWDATYAQFLGTTQEFDAYGNVLKSIDPLGGETLFQYDSFGFLEQTTNAIGHVATRTIDPRFGIEIARTDVNGHNIAIITNGFGETTEIQGESPTSGWVTLKRFSKTSAGYGYVNQSFQRRHWEPSMWGPEWDWKEELHDGFGRIYATRERGSGADAIRTPREYEDSYWIDRLKREGRPRYEDPGVLDRWTEYEYDWKGRITRVTMPSTFTQTLYDDVERKITKIDPNGEQLVLYMNPRSKLARKIDPVGAETFYRYDPVGRLIEIADPNGPLTQTVYDSLGRRLSVTDRNTGETTFHYDATGHLTIEIDEKGQRVGRTYDALDRTVERRIWPPGMVLEPTKIVHYEYDDAMLANSIGEISRVTVTVDESVESAYEFAYDAYGRQTNVRLDVDRRSFVWSKGFDPAGHNIELMYPDGALLRTTHNSAGNLDRLEVHERDAAAGHYTTHARYVDYNAEGQPGLLFHANGVVSCYRYDPDNGLLTQMRTSAYDQSFADPCAQPGHPQETPLLNHDYIWDGQVHSLLGIVDNLDPSRSQSYGYNARGELASAQGLYGSHDYTYDAGGNLTSRDGAVHLYDGQRVVDTGSAVMTYDDNGNMTSKTETASGDVTAFTWDEEDQLVEVDVAGVTTRYVYDFEGRRLMKQDPDGTTYYVGASYEIFVPLVGDQRHTKYVPGPMGKLAQITRTDVTLVSMAPATYGGISQLYARDSLVGLLQRGRYRAQAWLSSARTLEPADARWALLLLSLACGLLVGTLWLRAAGRASRTGRARAALGRSLSDAGWVEEAWAAEFERPRATLAVRRHPGRLVLVPVVLFAFIATYGLGRGGLALADLEPTPYGPGVPGDGVYYLHSNHIGSTLLVTDAVGSVATQIEYEPYGRVYQAGSSGSDLSRPKLTGREWDDSAGIYHLGARYYDPDLGRFISPDPGVGADAIKTVSLNRYAYAGNNPVIYVDPSGRFFWAALAVVAVAAVVGGLILGTEGKIISDPAHAFDNWSWSRALVGAWLGVIVAVVGFALGTVGVGAAGEVATLFGVPVSKIAVATFGGGVVSATFSYVQGEQNPGKLLAQFGIGMLMGFISSSGGMGLAGIDTVSKLTSEAMTVMGVSALKKALNPESPLTLQIWAFNFSFSKEGEVSFGANVFFLVSQGFRAAHNANGLDASAAERMRDGWSWENIAEEVSDPERGDLGWMLSEFTPAGYGAPSGDSVYSVMSGMLTNVVRYSVQQALTAAGWDENSMDMINFGVDQGVGAAWNPAMKAYREELKDTMLKDFSNM